jgi:AcrR family transcriptional regulator
VGRPRALTRQQVIDTALQLGLEGFTMKSVAEQLGVTITTLYKYVADRDELLRLVVSEVLSALEVPVDTGQRWPDYVRQFAAALGRILLTDAHVLDSVIHRGMGLETEIRLTENFLDVMTRRGFEAEDALRLLRIVGTIVYGVAVRTHSDHARIERSGSLKAAFDEALTHFPVGETQQVRSVQLTEPMSGGSLMEVMLAPILEQVARERGETL